jgi:hypothetical protein
LKPTTIRDCSETGRRFLIGSYALFFHLGKFVWPVGLCFFYGPADQVGDSPQAWLLPALWIGLLLILSFGRNRWGGGPFIRFALYTACLAPIYAVNIGIMRWTHFCDHWLNQRGPLFSSTTRPGAGRSPAETDRSSI